MPEVVPVSPQQRPPEADGNELRELARLAFEEAGRFPAGIGQVHRAVSRRAFRGVGMGVGAAAKPVQIAHDSIARSVYGGLRGGARAAGRATDAAIERRAIGDGRPLSVTPLGSAVVAAITGLIGDTLEEEGSALASRMAVRVDGHPLALEPDAVRAAFPDATGRPVVFLHGLMETEFSWRYGAGPDGETYGSRLARDLGCTPVYVRYNTGRHVSQNGRSLAELLERLLAAWPVEVDQLALVGHSMGGLVARTACYLGEQDGHDWTSRVRHVVSLGTPHMGAPLEQVVHVASAALHAVPETRPLAGFLRRRSGGIRDLRRGSLVDEDWRDRDPDALRAAACREIPLLECATHCFVSASVTRSERHPVARVIGDVLVLVPSASGRSRTRRIPFKTEFGAHVGPATHFALLNHPEVYERLRHWLATSPRELAAAG